MFYGARRTSTIFHELRKTPGERIVVSQWKVIRSFDVVHIGYSREVFERLKAVRECPQPKLWPPTDFPFSDYRDETAFLDNAYSELFTQEIPEGQEERYKISIAITEFLLHLSSEMERNGKADRMADAYLLPHSSGRSQFGQFGYSI